MYTIKRFEDKIVAVTGGAKGIGKGCCLRFAQEGARVAVLDLAMDDAAAVAAECEKLSGQPALALRCNVADAARRMSESGDSVTIRQKIKNAAGEIEVLTGNTKEAASGQTSQLADKTWMYVVGGIGAAIVVAMILSGR